MLVVSENVPVVAVELAVRVIARRVGVLPVVKAGFGVNVIVTPVVLPELKVTVKGCEDALPEL
jgi:hypothetical protein